MRGRFLRPIRLGLLAHGLRFRTHWHQRDGQQQFFFNQLGQGQVLALVQQRLIVVRQLIGLGHRRDQANARSAGDGVGETVQATLAYQRHMAGDRHIGDHLALLIDIKLDLKIHPIGRIGTCEHVGQSGHGLKRNVPNKLPVCRGHFFGSHPIGKISRHKPASISLAVHQKQTRPDVTPMPPKLILASSWVYRQALLDRLKLPFEAIGPEVDETPIEGESPKALAVRLAHAKAQAVAASTGPEAAIIGSDQVAECNGRILGKPLTEARAVAQLLSLSDQSVTFHTAMVVVCGERVFEHHCPTDIKMRRLTRDEVVRYVHIDQPLHCAAAFKSESLGIALTASYQSTDPTAIIGLPLIELAKILRTLGFITP